MTTPDGDIDELARLSDEELEQLAAHLADLKHHPGYRALMRALTQQATELTQRLMRESRPPDFSRCQGALRAVLDFAECPHPGAERDPLRERLLADIHGMLEGRRESRQESRRTERPDDGI